MSSSSSAASAATQDEQLESSRTATPPPVLTEQIRSETAPVEDEMLAQINDAIRRLLTRPNHQSPYRYSFQWIVDEEPNLNYRVFLNIREPSSRRISR